MYLPPPLSRFKECSLGAIKHNPVSGLTAVKGAHKTIKTNIIKMCARVKLYVRKYFNKTIKLIHRFKFT